MTFPLRPAVLSATKVLAQTASQEPTKENSATQDIGCVRKSLLIACLALCGAVSVGCQDASERPEKKDQPLQLTIRSDKNVYTEGEPIELVAMLSNSGKAAARIYSPEYFGVSEIVVEDSSGVRVSPRGIKVDRTAFATFMVIPSGEERSVRFDNLRWFLCGSAQEFAGSAQLARGRYTIHVTVTNPPVYACGEDPSNPRRPFEKTDLAGKLTSNKITLRIGAAPEAGTYVFQRTFSRRRC